LLRSLSRNHLGAEGAAALAPALAANGALTSLNLSRNQLCGLDENGRGIYTAVGIAALADAMRVNGALTTVWTSAREPAQAPNTEPSVCALGLAARSLRKHNWR
jgi:hypothetical protein